MLVELALRDTVGAGSDPTATFTVSSALPPAPVQFNIKLLSAVNELMVCEPEVLLLPDQSPEAVQLLASLDDQLRVVEPL